jgi:hypothetical protein
MNMNETLKWVVKQRVKLEAKREWLNRQIDDVDRQIASCRRTESKIRAANQDWRYADDE